MKDEWVEQKPDSQQPGIAELAEEVGPGRRVDPRLYFHDSETPLEQQSTGVPAIIQAPGLLFNRQLGRGIVKDLSVGGVGFIASSRLELPPRVLLLLDDYNRKLGGNVNPGILQLNLFLNLRNLLRKSS